MTEPVALGMPKRLSHSQLTSYMSCSEQYRLVRRRGLPDSYSWALAGGSAFHSWTELYDRGIPLEPEAFVQFLDEQVKSALKDDRNTLFDESDIKPTGRASKDWPNKRDRAWWEHHGPIFAQKYIDWRASDNELLPPESKPDEDFLIEQSVEGTLGGIDVLGYIDRLVLDSPFGKPVIVDIKGLPLDTDLPTPDGWTTMGEIQVGDEVFDKDGRRARVTAKSRVKRIGTYRINFHDGSSMVVDREHIVWASRGYREPSAVPVQEIVRQPRRNSGSPLWRVPIAQPLDTPDADLEVKPYVLGAWLGDGQESRCVITKDRTLFAEIEKEGVEMGVEQSDGRSKAIARTLLGYRERLASVGVLGNKHIPAPYLRASFGQRLALLQGLMDTDGTVNIHRGRAAFSGCNERLVRDVAELLRTLGVKAIVHHVSGHGFGKDVGVWVIEFSSPFNPFRRTPQAAKWEEYCSAKNLSLSQWRTISSIEEGPDVETQCIAVDSESHTYLATRDMIPTHNTGKEPGTSLQLATYAVLMSKKLGIPIQHGAFYLAEKGELSSIIDLSKYTGAHIESMYDDARRGIEAGVYIPNPNAFCSTCPVKMYCRLYGNTPPEGVPLNEGPIE